MADERVLKTADILVNYSIFAKKGDTIGISGGTRAEPLITAIYEMLLKKGAFPIVKMQPGSFSEILFKHGKSCHFNTLTPYQKSYVRCVDKTIGISAQENTRNLSGTKPALSAALAKTTKPMHDILRKKPWVLTLFPTQACAQDAEMSLSDFENFVYGAMFADQDDPIRSWKKLSKRQDVLVSRLKGADCIRIVGAGTDLTLSVKGRPFLNSDGKHNMPSGEVFSAPIERSANGYIEYDYPVCRAGREIDGIRLVFKDGKVVEASARKNEKFLLSMINTDKGAMRIGELGIGTNMSIQRFIKNILFDEKIGGTIHLALGNSIAGTGGRNRSAIHWDMIKDLRKGGSIYVDGKVFQKDGVFK